MIIKSNEYKVIKEFEPSCVICANKTLISFLFLQKEWRESYSEFKRKVARCVRKSQEQEEC